MPIQQRKLDELRKEQEQEARKQQDRDEEVVVAEKNKMKDFDETAMVGI